LESFAEEFEECFAWFYPKRNGFAVDDDFEIMKVL
jgi:hypothetical protein